MKTLTTNDPVVALLYELVRDHVSVGSFEQTLQETMKCPNGANFTLTNGFLGEYVKESLERLQNRFEVKVQNWDALRGSHWLKKSHPDLKGVLVTASNGFPAISISSGKGEKYYSLGFVHPYPTIEDLKKEWMVAP